MEVGHRLSRQRRHLPTNVSVLQHQGSPTSSTTSQHQQSHGITDSDDMDADEYCHNYRSQQSSRARKLQAKKRMQHNFGNLVTSSKRGSAAANGSTWMSIRWRAWFWRLCVLWLAFLILRIVTSIWQGDTTRLGLNQYLYQTSWTWW